MKRRVMAMLLALCMGVTPVVSGMAEELELFISTGELVLDKSNQTDEESALDSVNKENASILEDLGKKDWTSLAASVAKKGDWREDIVAVAQTQVGYTEEADGMTIYAKWAEYETAQAWTALFVNWVTAQAGLTEEDFPRLDSYAAFTERMNKVHALKNVSRSSYPMSGDLALIEKDDRKLIGVVVYVSNGVASVIIGDDNGAVTTDTYYVGQSEFKQYIDLDVLMERAGIEVGKGGEVPVIPEGGVAAWTNTNAVYMRSEPTTASKRVTTVKKTGTALLVVSAELEKDGYIWYGVEYGKYEGYIRGDLLDLDRAAIPTATPVPTATPAPTATPVPTVVPGCALCVSVSDGVALPMDCCYEHLAALGSEYANQFMLALMEADPLTRQLYVNCHDAHVAAGAEAIIPLGGFGIVERVVNIDVKKALVGEAVTIGFEIYGAKEYEWFSVIADEEGEINLANAVAIPDSNQPELTVYAKPNSEINYFCVATLSLANGGSVKMQSKLTTVSSNNAPITAVAILGEEVNFSYEYVGADKYRWYRMDAVNAAAESVVSEAENTADTAKFTTYAAIDNAGDLYYCEALKVIDGLEYVLSTSSYFTYTIDMEDMCKYVDELVNMTRTERYEIMIGLWKEAGLAERVTEHWKNGCDGKHFNDYFRLLCCCAETLKHPFGSEEHETYCGWYIAPETSTEEIVVSLNVPYGMEHYEECEITDGVWYDLYLDDVLVQSGKEKLLRFEGADYERTYRCVVTMADGSESTVTYVITANEISSLQQYLGDITSSCSYWDEAATQYVYDRMAVYELMTQTLPGKVITVRDPFTGTVTEVELVAGLFMEWKQYGLNTEKGMFCICCANGTILNDKIMLHPDALHKTDCPWYEKPETVSSGSTGVTVNGVLPDGLILSAEAKNPDHELFTLMQDDSDGAIRVSLKAYDITPKSADGIVWQPAKGATVKVTIPNVYDPNTDVAVNVYHLLVDESEIAPGYGYEKLSSEHFNGVILNDDGSITFETDGFSTFYVEILNDQCALCTQSVICAYSSLLNKTQQEIYQEKSALSSSAYAAFLADYKLHLAAGEMDIFCRCGEDERPLPPSAEHKAECLWSGNITHYANLLLGDVQLLTAPSIGTWTREDSADIIATAASISVVAGVEPERYLWTSNDGEMHTYVVSAQTTVLYQYYEKMLQLVTDYSVNPYAFDQHAIYDYMISTSKWNQVIGTDETGKSVTMAETVLRFWLDIRWPEEYGMFCTCCIDVNGVVSDEIMRHPDAVHKESCKWKHDVKTGLTPLVRVDGTIEGYVLAMTDANGNVKVVATTDMLDGKYHYFKDVVTGLYVAYLHTDENDVPWIIPLKSERDNAN